MTTEKIEPLTWEDAAMLEQTMRWLRADWPGAAEIIDGALSLERAARQKAEERVRELEDVISGCVLCSSPDTRWDEAMARYRAALTTDPPKEG
jgi:hypothetical protein